MASAQAERYRAAMTTTSCLCGGVRVHVDTRPDYLHECNCTLCAKSGARWAYVHPSQARVEGETKGFRRADKEAPNAEIRFCPTCGATTHFILTERAVAAFGNSMLGVNMALAEPGDVAGIELRFPDGRAWPGEGDFTYLREPIILR